MSSSLTTPEITSNTTIVQTSSSNREGRGPSRGHGGRGGQFNRGRFGGGRFNSGRAPSLVTTNHIICQGYSKPCHSALVCYHRFNHVYQQSSPPSIATNYCVVSSYDSNMWYPDNGASHRMISNFSNLNIYADDYTRSNHVQIDCHVPKFEYIIDTTRQNFLFMKNSYKKKVSNN